MGVGLSYAEVGLLKPATPDFGQVFYMVDSDYRTAAQGWSKADRTGPLDLWDARKAGQGGVQYVFRTGDYSSDAAAMQACIDGTVDFRGDVMFLTPGNYAPATALAVDSSYMRLLGPRAAAPQVARSTVTAGVAAALTVSVDGVEVGYLKFVPLTAATLFSLSAGADNLHFHDFFYDADGIAASTSTIFATAAGNTNNNILVEDFHFRTDAAQGPLLSFGATFENLIIRNYTHIHNAGTLATALLTTAGACTGVLVWKGRGFIAGGGAVTNLINWNESGADTVALTIEDVKNSIGYCAASGLVALTNSEAAEVNLSASYLGVVSGGAGGAGTTYTA